LAKILIADHDRDFRELVIFTFRFTGHIMYGASSSDECLEFARQHHPDLVLMELDLPDLSGVETCLKLKDEENTESIPIIFLVDPDMIDSLNDKLATCGADYLLKSLSPDQLTFKVNRFLKHVSKSNG
jgi:DNA-binding response OmpR family regulator